MRRSLPTLAVLILVPASLVVTPSAAVAADTCQGLTVTIAPSGSTFIRGTTGDDVIAAGTDTSTIRAGSGDDVICAFDTVEVDAGTGRDRVLLTPNPEVTVGATRRAVDIEAGTGGGRDTVVLFPIPGREIRLQDFEIVTVDTSLVPGGTIDLDLAEQTLTRSGLEMVDFDTRSTFGTVTLRSSGAGKVSVTGTDGPDDLIIDAEGSRRLTVDAGAGADEVSTSSCRGTVKGGEGRDVIRAVAADLSTCAKKRTIRLKGGGGRDRLYGTTRADVLLGGPGRDTAVGRAGRDRCQAEKTKSCER